MSEELPPIDDIRQVLRDAIADKSVRDRLLSNKPQLLKGLPRADVENVIRERLSKDARKNLRAACQTYNYWLGNPQVGQLILGGFPPPPPKRPKKLRKTTVVRRKKRRSG